MSRRYDSQKRILVTGGSGFPGSHLIDRLLTRVHEVVCADNLFTGTRRLPLPASDPRQRRPDIGLAQSLLDWSPSIALKVGLGATIQYFRDLVQPSPVVSLATVKSGGGAN